MTKHITMIVIAALLIRFVAPSSTPSQIFYGAIIVTIIFNIIRMMLVKYWYVQKLSSAVVNVAMSRQNIDYREDNTQEELNKRFISAFYSDDLSVASVFAGYLIGDKEGEKILEKAVSFCFDSNNFPIIQDPKIANFTNGIREYLDFACGLLKYNLEREPTKREYQVLLDFDLSHNYAVHAIYRARAMSVKLSKIQVKKCVEQKLAKIDLKKRAHEYRMDVFVNTRLRKVPYNTLLKPSTILYLIDVSGLESYLFWMWLLMRLGIWKELQVKMNNREHYSLLQYTYDIFIAFDERRFRDDLKKILLDTVFKSRRRKAYLWFG